MERNVNINEITDGKLYEANDMVKVGCNDCKGCSACCQGMGNSIVLDPFDVHQLVTNLGKTFEELLIDKIELAFVDGIIMPNLKMAGETEKCLFLNAEGRCSIHTFRPGICRLFPLGRLYEDHSFSYILQTHECPKDNKTKIKVRKWIDTVDVKSNEKFVNDWHYFLKDLQTIVKNVQNNIKDAQVNTKEIQSDGKDMQANINHVQEENKIKNISMYVLNTFYRKPFDPTIDFYQQFQKRLDEAKDYVASFEISC